MKHKNSPLQIRRPIGGHQRRGAAIAGARRGPKPVPQIFVKLAGQNHCFGCGKTNPIIAKAHLRKHRGYLELCWREGDKIRTLHLGKVRQNPPTAAAPAADVDELTRPARRRGKSGRRAA